MDNLNKITKAELAKMLEEVQAEKDELKKQNEEKEKEVADQMTEMKAMLVELQAKSKEQVKVEPTVQQTRNIGEDYVTIISNLIGANAISIDKYSTVMFDRAGAEESVSVSECQQLLRFSNNKRLFAGGLLMFAEQSDYERFKIKPRKTLTEDYLISLFDLDVDEFVSELDKITDKRTDSPVMHTVSHRIGLLYHERKIQVTMEIMEEFERYFGVGLMSLNIQFLVD